MAVVWHSRARGAGENSATEGFGRSVGGEFLQRLFDDMIIYVV